MVPTYIELQYSDSLKYVLHIASKVTIVQGDSATGKTIMLNAFTDYKHRQHDDRVSHLVVSPVADMKVMAESYPEGSILFMDEDDVELAQSRKVLRDIWKTNNYLVLITRVPITAIAYGIGDLYKLQTHDGVTSAVRIYGKFIELPAVSSYACEDEGSGFQYWDNYLPDTVTMHGRYNWVYFTDRLCFIMDAAALGTEVRDILKIGIQLFAPQSFEYLLLCYYTTLSNKDLIGLLEPKHLSYERLFNAMCCATQQYLGFQYDKRDLPTQVYQAKLVPELKDKDGKVLSTIKQTEYLSEAVCKKKDCKHALNKLLNDLGFAGHYEAVYASLPDTVENDTFVDCVLTALGYYER